MKDTIRIIFFKNIGDFLDGENFKYIVKQNNGHFIINEYNDQCNFNDYIKEICYDFDELSMYNKQRYEKSYIELKRVDNNIYLIKNKTYFIKRNLFT